MQSDPRDSAAMVGGAPQSASAEWTMPKTSAASPMVELGAPGTSRRPVCRAVSSM